MTRLSEVFDMTRWIKRECRQRMKWVETVVPPGWMDRSGLCTSGRVHLIGL